jgi:hypothetical protein
MTMEAVIQWAPLFIAFFSFIGVWISICTLKNTIKSHNKQLSAASFIACVNKYDSIVAEFPIDYWYHRYDKDYPEPEDTEELRRTSLKYFHLCAQEFYMQKEGFVDQSVWEIWKRELKPNIRTKLLRREWIRSREQFKVYEKFADYVDKVLRQDSSK